MTLMDNIKKIFATYGVGSDLRTRFLRGNFGQ